MPTSHQLKPGDTVMVSALTDYPYMRAISLEQRGGVVPATVKHAYPAGNDRAKGKARTEIVWEDGTVKQYPTNAEWIMA